MTAEDLLPRVGRIVRIKIANPGDPSVPAKEWTARIERVWADQGIVDIHVGYTTLHPFIRDIISVEGGLGSTDGNPAQTVTL